MDNFLNKLQTKFHEVRQTLTPVLRESAFFERGVLTPEEFVSAGDQLVSSQRQWCWMAGETDTRKSYLPAERQYLFFRGAVCSGRASTLASSGESTLVEGGDWVCGGEAPSTDEYEDLPNSLQSQPQSDPEDEYVDPAIASLQEVDQAVTRPAAERRFYNVSIVYDNYYRTPRVYLQGSTSAGVPLTPAQMLEDIIQDYAGKTATLEKHPHEPAAGLHISIHPCRHAETMVRLLNGTAGGTTGQTPTVASYMVFFLKFIASMIPTIDYDYTYNIGGR